MENNLQSFVEKLSDSDWLKKVGPALALLDAGNVPGLVRYAKTLGYEFTPQDVKDFLASIGASENQVLQSWIEKAQ